LLTNDARLVRPMLLQHMVRHWNHVPIVFNSTYISTSGLAADILDFLIPVWSDNLPSGSDGLRDPETIGVAVEIAFLTGLQAEIFKVLPVWRPLSLTFHF
jgi:hypothetical protein